MATHRSRAIHQENDFRRNLVDIEFRFEEHTGGAPAQWISFDESPRLRCPIQGDAKNEVAVHRNFASPWPDLRSMPIDFRGQCMGWRLEPDNSRRHLEVEVQIQTIRHSPF